MHFCDQHPSFRPCVVFTPPTAPAPSIRGDARKENSSFDIRATSNRSRPTLYNVAALLSSWPSRINLFFSRDEPVCTSPWKPEHEQYVQHFGLPRLLVRQTDARSRLGLQKLSPNAYRRCPTQAVAVQKRRTFRRIGLRRLAASPDLWLHETNTSGLRGGTRLRYKAHEGGLGWLLTLPDKLYYIIQFVDHSGRVRVDLRPDLCPTSSTTLLRCRLRIVMTSTPSPKRKVGLVGGFEHTSGGVSRGALLPVPRGALLPFRSIYR